MKFMGAMIAFFLICAPMAWSASETNPNLSGAAQAFEANRWSEAIEAIDRAESQGKLTGADLGRAKAWRSIALIQLGRPTPQALADGTAAPELAPKFAPAFFARALVKEHKDDYEGAIADFNEATTLDSNYYEAILYRGVLNLQLRRPFLAWPDIDLTIQMRPDDPRGYLYRAILLLERKMAGDAEADARKILELAPKLNRARLILGMALATQDKNREAVAELEAYAKVQPDNPQAYLALAEACEKLNRWDKAVEYWEKTNALVPGLEQAAERLKKARVKAGQGG